MLLAHQYTAARRAPWRSAAPRGDTIVEALIATMLLTIGALALVGLTVVLARDERRLATRRRAAALLAQRAAEWAAIPCGDAAGVRVLGGLQERWQVSRAADSLEVLVDSVAMPADPTAADGAFHVAVRGCAP
jgi:Tfp pilus assembly protein PilV